MQPDQHRKENTLNYTVLDKMPIGVFIIKQDMTVVFWNECLEYWTGTHRDELLGTKITRVYPHLSERRYQSRLVSVFDGGPPAIFSSQLHQHLIPSALRHGELRSQHTTVTGMTDDSGNRLAMFAIEDVTEMTRRIHAHREARDRSEKEIKRREEAEKILEQVNKELLEANVEMEEFVYSCSHDMKSPLVTISGYAGWIEKKLMARGDDELLGLVEPIIDASKRQIKFINCLADLGRAGRDLGEPEQIRLAEVATDALADHAAEIEEKHVEIEEEFGDFQYFGFRQPMHRILSNLIGNALKYACNEDNAKVFLGLMKQEKAFASMTFQQFRIYVRDNGPGIDPQHHAKIFEIFSRLDAKHSGSGIGLATVRKLTERMQGRVWVESENMKGATFWVELPKQIKMPINQEGMAA